MATPRLAATAVVLRATMDVLMLRRHSRQAFPSARAFPGGLVDDSDRSPDWRDLVTGDAGLPDEERALRIAACRETFEETGLVLTVAAGAGENQSDRTNLPAFLRERNLRLNLGDLKPIGHWITPTSAPRRFDTHFYLCLAPPGQEAVGDGVEATALEWFPLIEARADRIPPDSGILFPTWMTMRRLSAAVDLEDCLDIAAAFRPWTTTPQVETTEEGFVVYIDAGAGYGVTEHHLASGDLR